MDARWTIAGAVSLVLVAGPARAQGPTADELRITWDSPLVSTSPVASAGSPAPAVPVGRVPAVSSRSTPALALGGLAGGAAGLVGGFYLGAVLADDDDLDDLDTLAGGVAGAAIGEMLLLPLGVHLANRGRGSYAKSALASFGIAAAGILALSAVHHDPPGAPIVLVAVPVSQIAASIAIERATD